MRSAMYRCTLLLIPLIVSCWYTGDERGPAIVLSVVVLHFLGLILVPYDHNRYSDECPPDRNRHLTIDTLFLVAAALSIAVLAGGHSDMAVAATVLAILADIFCTGEKDSCRFRRLPDGRVSTVPYLL